MFKKMSLLTVLIVVPSISYGRPKPPKSTSQKVHTSALYHDDKVDTIDVYDYYTDYKKVLKDLYHDIDAIIPEEERQKVSKTGGSPVYGEIEFESVNFLLSELKLTEDDVFYDLGSGLGKFVLQVYLMTPAQHSVGIEFSSGRFKRAHPMAAKAKKIYKNTVKFENDMRKSFGKPALPKITGKTCKFYNEDMLTSDLSDATVVFTCSTCFGEEFMQKLTDKLADNDTLRILTLRQLPYHKHIHYVTTYVLPMTWSPEVPVYMYKVDQSKVAPRADERTDEKTGAKANVH